MHKDIFYWFLMEKILIIVYIFFLIEMMSSVRFVCISKSKIGNSCSLFQRSIWYFSGNPFFFDDFYYVSNLLYPPTHLVSKRKHLATPTHPPFWLRNKWMVPNYISEKPLLWQISAQEHKRCWNHQNKDNALGTIQILRNQKGGWVGLAKCLRLLTRWVGGDGKMLT